MRKLVGEMAEIQKLEVCRRIQKARKEAGLTQEEAADLLLVTTRAYQTWEADRVPWRRMDDVAEALGTSKGWLLHGAEGPPPASEQTELMRQLLVEMQKISKLLGGRDGEQDPDTG